MLSEIAMIVDCFTHTWESADQLGRCVPPQGSGTDAVTNAIGAQAAGPSRHLAAGEPVDTTIVLGFKSHYLEADIPNDQIARFVSQSPDRLIGFAGIDPHNPKEAVAELLRVRDDLDMQGVAIAPAAQDYHPSNSQAMQVYAEAAQRNMPAVFHTGVFVTPATKLEYAQPILLDEVARELPDLKIIIAHMGYPWVSETVMLLSKHKNVFAEISWLLDKPWEAYRTFLIAYQHGVTNKLLFGSGFPHTAASAAIEALYSINHLVHGTNLPTIPRESLRGIVERDTLSLLGLRRTSPIPQLEPTPSTADDPAE